MAHGAKNLSEEHEALYQMICSLKSEDIQKVVNYVSFLRFVEIYKDKAMTDLLKIESTQNGYSKTTLGDSRSDTFSTQLPNEKDSAPDKTEQEFMRPESMKSEAVESAAAEPDAELAAAAHKTYDHHEDDENFYAPIRSDYRVPGNKTSEISPIEEPLLEPAQPELAQPVAAYNDSEVADESFPQETPLPVDLPGRMVWRVIRSLRLNLADAAFLFHISPSMARMWRTDLLGVEDEIQLQYLLEMAERVEEMDIPRLDQVIRHPLPDGEFFLEKLRDRKVTDESLKALRETAERCENLRRKFKGATKPFHTMQNAIGRYAVPLHCEG